MAGALHLVGLQTDEEQQALRARSLAAQEAWRREHAAALAQAEQSAKVVEEMRLKMVARQAERRAKVEADSAQQRANLDASLQGITKIVVPTRGIPAPEVQPSPPLPTRPGPAKRPSPMEQHHPEGGSYGDPPPEQSHGHGWRR